MSEIFRGRIKEIVRGSDLATLSSKKIRQQLEEEFKTDLSKRKKEIDDIVMGLLVSESQSEQSQNATAHDKDQDSNDISEKDHHKKKKKSKDKEKSSNSHKRKHSKDQPKSKKSKLENSTSEDSSEDKSDTAKDAELARMLQDEEDDEMDELGRRGLRRTRRRPHKPAKMKDAKKKPTVKKDSMFKKVMVLSPELAAIMGTNRMPRSEVVQRMWQIVKERDLRDPSNKQYHICDEQLMKVFGVRRVRTFSMMKYLKSHVKDPALLTNS